ncbi:DUF6298 domain-containing protein [Asticcacaulis sp. BYS171W]|uniref:DUF6298 domain-containing protein n=1 Tax=Asticcacaulis aquaticus TaxID=2984212 RepID=A0ABT5HXH7_9CAUL|nr:DUF6298 domain-containing protein [Asticcacaulis aquaticus]MDC7684141.1 DUF6298 domain-containing protein [Asticcacaulis aquaticus]
MKLRLLLSAALWLAIASGVTAEAPTISAGTDGRLVYAMTTDGQRMIDFSSAGYAGGGVALPLPAPTLLVKPVRGDAGGAIQAAIDLVATRQPDANGIRGVILLAPGEYRIKGQVRIKASGIVLRGSGTGDKGTILIADGHDRRTLIDVAGEGSLTETANTRRAVSGRAPTGTVTLELADTTGLKAGDAVVVHRPSTKAWIAALGMDQFPGWRPENRLHWQPGTRDIVWERRIVAVNDKTVTLDAPLTTTLVPEDGAYVSTYAFDGRLRQVGIENLRLVSNYDTKRPKDEDHSWVAIGLDKVEDAWVRDVETRHFVSYAVHIGPDARRVTVQDIAALDPVGEVGGFRRRMFYTAGQQTLIQRCFSRHGGHDLSTGHAAAGPNVFLDCRTEESLDDSGPLESWASGVLFDRVKIRGDALRLTDRDTDGQGAGWTAANSVAWNSEATDIEARNPPGAWNLAFGSMATVHGDGIVTDARAVAFRDFYRGEPIGPSSLYRVQLFDRLGEAGLKALERQAVSTNATGVPVLTAADIKAYEARQAAAQPAPKGPLKVENGRFVIDGQPAWTGVMGYSWFQGQIPPTLAPTFGHALVRYVPGRTGTGYTDDLEAVVEAMKPGMAFNQFYPLWYDRRRVNHNYDGSAERDTGEVWGPLLEQPWARSGEGVAWDGLSKYDLTKYNPWYFDRIADFAKLADQRGRILYYNFYFQHNLLESRAHYADFAWRPENTIQPTGLPFEVPAANIFYDVSDPLRRDLHRRYIRHSLGVLKDRTNVVYGIDQEYTGDDRFLDFWFDEVTAWSKEKRKPVFINLKIPKPQLDRLLADPVRGPKVAAVEFHHWVYRPDGSLYSVKSGINKAPREQTDDIVRESDIAALKAANPGLPADLPKLKATSLYGAMRDGLWKTTKPMQYRAWREYRDRYPHIVVLTTQDRYPDLTSAIETALPDTKRAGLVPVDAVVEGRETAWMSKHPSGAWLVYSPEGTTVRLDPAQVAGAFRVTWISPAGTVDGGVWRADQPLNAPAGKSWAAWLTPETAQ